MSQISHKFYIKRHNNFCTVICFTFDVVFLRHVRTWNTHFWRMFPKLSRQILSSFTQKTCRTTGYELSTDMWLYLSFYSLAMILDLFFSCKYLWAFHPSSGTSTVNAAASNFFFLLLVLVFMKTFRHVMSAADMETQNNNFLGVSIKIFAFSTKSTGQCLWYCCKASSIYLIYTHNCSLALREEPKLRVF